MANPEHVKIVKQGVDAIDAWRREHPKERLDLCGADLCGVNLTGADLSGALLENADLRKSNLTSAKLCHARLEGADLTEARFESTELTDVNLAQANLTQAFLEGAKLDNVELREARLNLANLHEAVLTNCSCAAASFEGANLRGANLSGATLTRTKFAGAFLEGANLRGCDLAKADLSGALLLKALMNGASLSGANLRSANLNKADLTGCDCRDVEVDSDTTLVSAVVDQCKVYRHTLEALKEYGGLASGDRMRMIIVDGLTTLRTAYSGFMQWVHLVALAAFLFPYGWFVVKQWGIARFGLGSEDSIPFWLAILRFIVNGGEGWEAGWDPHYWPLTAFLFALVYNGVRAVLLWKTKRLEMQEHASGLPVPFTLTGWWGRLYRASVVGFYVNLLALFVHTWHFLGQDIPILRGSA